VFRGWFCHALNNPALTDIEPRDKIPKIDLQSTAS